MYDATHMDGPPISSSEDALLETVELARAGDLEAFNALFRMYNARLCLYLARMVGNDEEGRDLAQETFLKAWRMLPGVQDAARFVPWLYRIATNVAIDYLRARRLRHWLSWEPDLKAQPGLPEKILQLPDPSASVAETEHVQQALARIKPGYRACLLLQIEGGFAQREIAQLLHLSEKSISIYVQRACEQFRLAYARLAPEQAQIPERSIPDEQHKR